MTRMYTDLLATYFGHTAFRPGQLEAIESVVSNHDTLVVLPTSTGKTLIFQFLTILNRQTTATAVTIVISPLIALMVDQVAHWNRAFVRTPEGQLARRASSERDGSHDRVAVLLGTAQDDPHAEADAVRGLYPVVYLAPEKLPYLSPLLRIHVTLLVIDECHCISDQGNAFRPAYRMIRPFFAGVRTLALTATAPPALTADLLANLALDNPAVIRLSMARPNLQLQVGLKQDRTTDLGRIRALVPLTGGRTVVFGTTRSECESLARDLGGWAYHAGLSVLQRAEVMTHFVDGAVLVATNCFGLGVDLPDIRLVIHYGLPRSLVGYVQECGRAGRDGAPATCLLLYRSSDVSKYKDSERDVRLATEMLAWCTERGCRRTTLLARFGEEQVSDASCHCDQCVCGPEETVTVEDEEDRRLLLGAIVHTGNYAGRGLPVDFVLGARTKNVTRFARDASTAYGRGKHRTRLEWILVHTSLVHAGLLREVVTTRGFVIYKLTESGHARLRGDGPLSTCS